MAFVDYEKDFDNIERWTKKNALNICRLDLRYRMLVHNTRIKKSNQSYLLLGLQLSLVDYEEAFDRV